MRALPALKAATERAAKEFGHLDIAVGNVGHEISWMQPDEVALAVVFLASDAANRLTDATDDARLETAPGVARARLIAVNEVIRPPSERS